MNRFFLMFAIFILFVTQAFAQSVVVQKSTYVAKETDVFQANQVVATNTRTGASLVVWERVTSSSREISARLLNSRGVPISPRITLVTDPKASHPAVIYNPVRNEFLLAYDDNPQVQLTRSDIFVMRLNSQGRPAVAAAKISTDSISSTMGNFFPKLAFNSRTSSYVALWLREIVNAGQSDDGNNGLVGALLTNVGATNGSAVLLQKSVIESNTLWGPIPQDVAFHPGNGKLLVCYVQILTGTQGRQANYSLGTIEANLSGVSAASFATVNATPLLLSQEFAWGARIAFVSNTAGVLYFVDTNNLQRRRIDAVGKLSGASATAFRPPKNNTKLFYPSVVFNVLNSVIRGILVGVENPFSDTGAANIWVQQLDAKGAALGAPVKVDTTAANDTAITTSIVALSAVQNLTGHRFSAFYTVAQFDSNQAFENSGIIKLNLTIPKK